MKGPASCRGRTPYNPHPAPRRRGGASEPCRGRTPYNPHPAPRRRGGASTIEFALTLPILLLVLYGVVEYGWFLFQLTSVVTATRDGTRLGVATAQDSSGTTPTSKIESEAIERTQLILEGYGIDCDSGDCTIDTVVDPAGQLTTLTLTTVVEYDPVIGLIPIPDNLRATYTMALEDQNP